MELELRFGIPTTSSRFSSTRMYLCNCHAPDGAADGAADTDADTDADADRDTHTPRQRLGQLPERERERQRESDRESALVLRSAGTSFHLRTAPLPPCLLSFHLFLALSFGEINRENTQAPCKPVAPRVFAFDSAARLFGPRSRLAVAKAGGGALVVDLVPAPRYQYQCSAVQALYNTSAI
eukprot:2138573-Rhodomonas_salina.2